LYTSPASSAACHDLPNAFSNAALALAGGLSAAGLTLVALDAMAP